MTDPTANVTAYAHDPLGRVVNVSVGGASGCAVCVLLSYSYNAASAQIGTESTISGDPANGSIAYGYDPLGRLASYAPAAPSIEHQAYGWAALPDRTSITRGTADPVTTAYDAASRPVSDASHSSDAQGRITKTPGSHSGEVLTLSWDPLGRLTSVSSSLGSSTSYTYDPLDRLETISSAGTVTSFLYVGLTDAVAQVSVTTSGATVTTKHATDLAGTELFEWVAGSDPVYLGRNLHNDVVCTYGPSGAPASHATYDPFGNLVASSGTVPATRWQSSWQDTSTGLYYVIARWYDPVSGAFLSTDPLDGSLSDPGSLDRYAYGTGDPVGSLDTSGQCGYDANTHTFSGTNCPAPPVTKPLPRQTPLPRRDPDPQPKKRTVTPSPAPTPAPKIKCTVNDTSYYILLYSGCGNPVMLDTSLVGWFMEPADHWEICASGALRVVLAFSGRNHDWRWPAWWHGDQHGTAYMLYLAQQVRVSGLNRAGLENGSVGANMYEVQLVANWEYSDAGRDSAHPYGDSSPFQRVFVNGEGFGQFAGDIEHMIRDLGTAVYIATRTSSLGSNIGLPSWDINGKVTHDTSTTWSGCGRNANNDYWSLSWALNKKTQTCYWSDGGHAVAVVGFDQAYFYYIDTCYRSTGCRHGPNDIAGTNGLNFTGSKVPHTWRIPKEWLYKLMYEWVDGGGYLNYSGPSVQGDPVY